MEYTHNARSYRSGLLFLSPTCGTTKTCFAQSALLSQLLPSAPRMHMPPWWQQQHASRDAGAAVQQQGLPLCPIRCSVAVLVAAAMCWHSLRNHSLSRTGAPVAFFIGLVHMACSWTCGGLLITFFLTSSKVRRHLWPAVRADLMRTHTPTHTCAHPRTRTPTPLRPRASHTADQVQAGGQG
jgi:hypothetical protein